MEQSSSLRLFGRAFLIAILVLVAVWILRPLLPALAWAGVLALATWPAREWLIRKGMTTSGAAILLTLLVGILIVGPLIIVAIEMAREAVVVVQTVHELKEIGLGTPAWVLQVPLLGDYVASWWRDHLADPDAAKELLGRAESLDFIHWTRSLGSEAVNRLAILAFTLLTLFFAYRDSPTIASQSRIIADRLFGPSGEHLGEEAIVAIRATVNGLVLGRSGARIRLCGSGREPPRSVRLRDRASRDSSIRSDGGVCDRLLHSRHTVPHHRGGLTFCVRVSRGLRCRSFRPPCADRRVDSPAFPVGSPRHLWRLGDVWPDRIVCRTGDHGRCHRHLAGGRQAGQARRAGWRVRAPRRSLPAVFGNLGAVSRGRFSSALARRSDAATKTEVETCAGEFQPLRSWQRPSPHRTCRWRYLFADTVIACRGP